MLINVYPLDSAMVFPSTYPLDSDLTALGPGDEWGVRKCTWRSNII